MKSSQDPPLHLQRPFCQKKSYSQVPAVRSRMYLFRGHHSTHYAPYSQTFCQCKKTFLIVTTWGRRAAAGFQWVGGRDATHPTAYRTAPHNQEPVWLRTPTALSLRNRALELQHLSGRCSHRTCLWVTLPRHPGQSPAHSPLPPQIEAPLDRGS